MSQTKHTPGPWTANLSEIDNGAPDTARIKSNKGVGVALTNHANARLIAAAPEMLKMLVNLQREIKRLSRNDDPCPNVGDVDALIAKARGET